MLRKLLLFPTLVLCLCGGASAAAAAPGKLNLPPGTSRILDHIYSGREDQAIQEAVQLEQKNPQDPLGYLLEDEAQWWKIWCRAAEFKYGMTMARHKEKQPSDQHFLEVAAKAYGLAEASLAQHPSAEMYLYAGMADAFSARLYSLRGENRATARAGVRARGNFAQALEMDPSLADADLGLGLYNYYVDTLSAIAKLLRVFMGIPGGSKSEGMEQLQRAIREGQLTPAVARFYLGINLHNYDHQYQEAFAVLEPLAARYPENPLFQLACGDLQAKLGRKPQAAAYYQAAAKAAKALPDAECRERVTELVRESLAALGMSS